MTSTSSESSESTSTQSDDKTIIDKILGEMKSEFNKLEKRDDEGETKSEEGTPEEISMEEEEADKPRLILSFKKPSPEASSKRAPKARSSPEDVAIPKRSARRRSKDYPESVLQSAIARKEKSYNEASKPQRLSRQLKPTQKILENLEMAKQERTKDSKRKRSENESCTEAESGRGDDGGELSWKFKQKHKKRVKKGKVELDTDESEGEHCRKLLLSSRSKESPTPDREESTSSPINGHIEPVKITLCLCTEKTKYFVALNEESHFCGAIDSIDSKQIGCSRALLSQELMMLRPSTKTPYNLFCDTHKNRLLRHNCCPGCGIFCTQGDFVECPSKHYFHRSCAIVINDIQSCPHCGGAAENCDVQLTMRLSKKPVFLPVQKLQSEVARMTFPSTFKYEDDGPLLPIGALDMQNSLEFGEEEYELNNLVTAVKNNSIEKVAIILGSKSVQINTKVPEFAEGTLLHYAAKQGFLPIVHMLLVAGLQTDLFDKDQNTALMLAVLASNTDVVQYLIRSGANITLKGTDGMTALHLAAKCGNLRACEILLKAATNIRNFVNYQDDGGWTPLVWACEHGYADIANFLIFKGADANKRDVEHNVALHWAAFSGSAHIAQLLMDKGCEVNAVNAHGDTPLHVGARLDMYDSILVLLARGADVTLLNKNKESALDCVPSGGDSYNPISLNVTLQSSTDCVITKVILSNDISKGKECNPIQCFNNVDDATVPKDFLYITKNCVSSDDVKIDRKITSLQCCDCEDRCVDTECSCGKFSLRCWYDEEGKLIQDFNFNDIPMIFECNDRCKCNAITCNNRVVQKGLTHRFEVFRTQAKGWGLRTLRVIPKGSFVCEYIGEILTDGDADKREDDTFLFDLESRVCGNPEADSHCIDARFYGNFSRFINHSCEPNLTSVKVFVEHQDLRFPRIAFFANREIACGEELGFDYGEKFWVAKYKVLACFCGSLECKYSEEMIEETVLNHQRKVEAM